MKTTTTHHSIAMSGPEEVHQKSMLIKPHLQKAAVFYPDIIGWFERTAIRGIMRNERAIITVSHADRLAAFAILKHTRNESKICTFMVLESFRFSGVGTQLMKHCLSMFPGTMPGISISEEALPPFLPLLKRFRFGMPLVHTSPYVRGIDEYVFDPCKRIIPLPGNGYYYTV